jgi:hypothetical protein
MAGYGTVRAFAEQLAETDAGGMVMSLMGEGKVIRRQRVPQEAGRVKADKQRSSGGGRSANDEQRSPNVEGGNGDANKGSD